MAAYTTIDDSEAHFQVKKWTGNAGSNAITLDGETDMQPDFMIHKEPADENGWHLFNSSTGVTKYMNWSGNGTEATFSGYLSSFDTNGFTAGSGDSSMNSSGTTQCSWLWKANGGTTSTDTNGDIDTTVQVNQTAGFSIVTYSPPNATARTIGHGLGAIPRFIIIRARNRVEDWHWFHYSAGTGGWRGNHAEAHNDNTTLGDTLPTSTVYKLGTDFRMNGAFNYVGYFFADVQGYSKFGSYTGNGQADNGPFVYTGFKPAFVMIKNTDTANRPFYMFDNARNTFNPNGLKLYPNTDGAEANDQAIDMLSNGFKVRPNAFGDVGTSSLNHSGHHMSFAAWAENPFVTSGGAPGTAR